MVTLTINGIEVSVNEGTTILEAARQAGLKIPTLCALKDVIEARSCRLCVVQIVGQDRLAASCGTFVEQGMVVHTNTLPVIRARRQNLKLILSQHNASCTSCVRSTNCELQTLASDLNMREAIEEAPVQKRNWPLSHHLQRDNSKCILCMRCVGVCDNTQACQVWDILGTGSYTRVDVRENKQLTDVNCALCGQCIVNCPVGALFERDDTEAILEAIADPEVLTVVNIAPAVRSAWAEHLGLSHQEATEPRMVAAMRAIGFDYVFDTDYAADLTIMEEGTELVDHIAHADQHPWPMFTSCCPGWVRYVKQNYPEFLPNLSSAKSPHQMLGAITKTYFADQQKKDPKKIFMVSAMPCVAKKYEASVSQLSNDQDALGHVVSDIDAVITTREFERLIRMSSIDVDSLKESEWDRPFGLSTGAGVIFGRTGGVMEAALRSAAFLITGELVPIEETAFDKVHRDDRPWTEKSLQLGDKTLNIAIASGLGNAGKLLESLKAKEVAYDFIEIMACPGGCINGGGQPIVSDEEKVDRRAQVLNRLDKDAPIRLSHENVAVQSLYEDYLEKPNSHRAHHLLHTDQSSWDTN